MHGGEVGHRPPNTPLASPPAPPAAPKLQGKNVSAAHVFWGQAQWSDYRFGNGCDAPTESETCIVPAPPFPLVKLAKHKTHLSMPLIVPSIPTDIQLGPQKKQQGSFMGTGSKGCYSAILGCLQELGGGREGERKKKGE